MMPAFPSPRTDGETYFDRQYHGSTQSYFPVLVGPDLTYNGGTDAFVARIYSYYVPAPRHAVGDFDGDGSDELAVDFGSAGVYLWDAGAWTQIPSIESGEPGRRECRRKRRRGDHRGLGSATVSGSGTTAPGDRLSGVNVSTMCTGDMDADGSAGARRRVRRRRPVALGRRHLDPAQRRESSSSSSRPTSTEPGGRRSSPTSATTRAVVLERRHLDAAQRRERRFHAGRKNGRVRRG